MMNRLGYDLLDQKCYHQGYIELAKSCAEVTNMDFDNAPMQNNLKLKMTVVMVKQGWQRSNDTIETFAESGFLPDFDLLDLIKWHGGKWKVKTLAKRYIQHMKKLTFYRHPRWPGVVKIRGILSRFKRKDKNRKVRTVYLRYLRDDISVDSDESDDNDLVLSNSNISNGIDIDNDEKMDENEANVSPLQFLDTYCTCPHGEITVGACAHCICLLYCYACQLMGLDFESYGITEFAEERMNGLIDCAKYFDNNNENVSVMADLNLNNVDPNGMSMDDVINEMNDDEDDSSYEPNESYYSESYSDDDDSDYNSDDSI